MTTLDEQDRALLLADAPPDRTPTSLPELVERVESFIRRFVVLTSAQSTAVALWVAHTHLAEAAEATPYIAVTSPERQSGKSRVLEVLDCLVPHPLRAASVSEAALFRIIAEEGSTILLDEVDAIFIKRNDREDLRALLNAGYRRGAHIVRCEIVGKTITPRRFDGFCPKALAGIGQLPDTVADRSIPIRLQRKHRGERIERFNQKRMRPHGEAIRDELALATDDPELIERLQIALPDLPEELDDRAQDGWEPLLAIADLLGGEWPARARAAAVELHTDGAPTESAGILLLRHLSTIFEELTSRDEIPSSDLLDRLVEIEQGPWPAWWGKDVEAGRHRGPASKLARLLKPYGVEPKKVGPRESRQQGYRRADLEPVWARYTDAPGVSAPRFPGSDGHTDNTRSARVTEAEPDGAKQVAHQDVSVCPPEDGERGGQAVATDDADVLERAAELVTVGMGAEVAGPAPKGGQLYVFAADLGFPRADLPDGTTLLEREDCWRAFCDAASPHDRTAAFRALREIETHAK